MAVTTSAAQLFSTSELPVNPVFDPPSNSRSGVGVEMEKLEPP